MLLNSRLAATLGTAALSLVGIPAQAQGEPQDTTPNIAETRPETRIGEKDFTSPPATLDQLDWLVGQWAGEGIQGAPAMESWLPPAGGTMVGTFVQEREDEDGPMKIMFTEHMYISEENGSLALKLKHFNADMTGWEEKDDFLTFRLVAIEECAAYFNALTLRCADKGGPGERLVAAVRMKGGRELVFRFDRVGPSKLVQGGSCADVVTTIDLNECLAKVAARAEAEHTRYLASALDRYENRPNVSTALKRSEAAFEQFREAECGAIFQRWIEGTIRGAMALSCNIEMTNERTHTIWQNWLTYADSTPPLLPEPEPTR